MHPGINRDARRDLNLHLKSLPYHHRVQFPWFHRTRFRIFLPWVCGESTTMQKPQSPTPKLPPPISTGKSGSFLFFDRELPFPLFWSPALASVVATTINDQILHC